MLPAASRLLLHPARGVDRHRLRPRHSHPGPRLRQVGRLRLLSVRHGLWCRLDRVHVRQLCRSARHPQGLDRATNASGGSTGPALASSSTAITLAAAAPCRRLPHVSAPRRRQPRSASPPWARSQTSLPRTTSALSAIGRLGLGRKSGTTALSTSWSRGSSSSTRAEMSR